MKLGTAWFSVAVLGAYLYGGERVAAAVALGYISINIAVYYWLSARARRRGDQFAALLEAELRKQGLRGNDKTLN